MTAARDPFSPERAGIKPLLAGIKPLLAATTRSDSTPSSSGAAGAADDNDHSGRSSPGLHLDAALIGLSPGSSSVLLRVRSVPPSFLISKIPAPFLLSWPVGCTASRILVDRGSISMVVTFVVVAVTIAGTVLALCVAAG